MIGDLNRRIGLYRPQVSADNLGGQVTSWPFWRAVWAQIEPLSPREHHYDGRAAILVPYKITIRYIADFPERVRLIWGSKTLRVITTSDPDGRRERLHLICEEQQQ